MKPLSAFTHFSKNKKKFFTLFIPVFLSIVLIYTTEMVVTSFVNISSRANIEPYRYFSTLAAKSKVISHETIDAALNFQKVMPWVFQYTNINAAIDVQGTKVFTVKEKDRKLLLDAMHLSLVEGRLPRAGTNEILLHKAVVINKGLKIGDHIGSKILPNEVLQGDYVLVGVIDGKSIISFASLEYWMKENNVIDDDFSTGMIFFSQDKEALSLDFLKLEDLQGIEFRTLESVTAQIDEELKGIQLILSLIDLMLILIITLCIGFLSFIYISQRRKEFGILNAMGFSPQTILSRVFREIMFLNVFAFLGGILLSIGIGFVLNLTIFNPLGLPLLLMQWSYLFKVSFITCSVIIFSLLPVWKMLRDLDPVSIIEGTD